MNTLNEPAAPDEALPSTYWSVWADPLRVVSDPTMSTEEKRAVLASWASDALAIPNYPPLRRLETGQLVSIDAVLDALKRLDGLEEKWPTRPDAPVRKGHWSRIGQGWRRYVRDDDDDDDPSSPAPAMRPPRFPVLDGAAAEAA
jgi:hypothetical protein